MTIDQNSFITPYEQGTHGAGDWKYYGNTWLWLLRSNYNGHSYEQVVAEFMDIPSKDDNIYDSIEQEVRDIQDYALHHEGWDSYDITNYYTNWLYNKINGGLYRDWETYKFCYADNRFDPVPDPGDLYPTYNWLEYPANTIVRCDTDYFHAPEVINMTYVRIRRNVLGAPMIDIGRTNTGPGFFEQVGTNDLIHNNYPIVATWASGSYSEQGIKDYLFNNQEPGPVPPGDPSMYDDDIITASDEYNNIIGNFLTNFTVLAEIDGTNLNLIAQALNTNITLDDSIPEMLAKIARSLVQKNIAEGILSIKIIPIPNGGTLPYKTGITETLFKPIGVENVQGKKLNNTIKKYPIGSMGVHKVFNDYRDFLCEYSIYLPFSGIHQLDADVIVGNTLNIYADIDFLTGAILYHLIVLDGATSRDIYTFTGDCAIELPITGADYSAKYESIMNGIFSGVGMIAGAMAGGPVGAMAGAGGVSALTTGLKTLGNAASVKGNYMQSGKLVPNSCALSVLYPYLIVSTPQDVSPDYTSVKGRPTHKMLKLNLLSGFAIVSNINLDSIAYATDEDKEALRSLLANGVYF